MTLTVTVDRIEGTTAVLEVSGAFVPWPLTALPRGAREGDRFTLTLQPAPADDAMAAAQARLDRLRAAGPSDDEIDL